MRDHEKSCRKCGRFRTKYTISVLRPPQPKWLIRTIPRGKLYAIVDTYAAHARKIIAGALLLAGLHPQGDTADCQIRQCGVMTCSISRRLNLLRRRRLRFRLCANMVPFVAPLVFTGIHQESINSDAAGGGGALARGIPPFTTGLG